MKHRKIFLTGTLFDSPAEASSANTECEDIAEKTTEKAGFAGYSVRKRRRVIALLFFVIVLLAFAMRTYHYNTSVLELGQAIGEVPMKERQNPSFLMQFLPYHHNNFSPFTIESAMMFGYAQDIAEGKGVPAHDVRLKHMEDIPPYAQMNMGLEWFLGWGWRLKNMLIKDPEASPREKLFQDHPYMAQWMSMQIRLWVSLISGFLFLWLILLRCPVKLAVWGGILHAVAPAAIARATGQDLVRGEFCIPLIVMSFVLMQWICSKPRIWKYPLLFATVFTGFVTWDLCQMIFSCWGLVEILRFVCGCPFRKPRFYAWCTIAAAVLLNALAVPFNVTYSLIRAPLVWAVLPAVGGCYAWYVFERRRKAHGRTVKRWMRLAVPVFFLLLYANWAWIGNTPEYASNYSHFSETMKAKLAFNNMKPADSSKLSFDARIMWTPSMHSATWSIAQTFFPSFLFGRRMNFGLFRFIFGQLPLTLSFFAFLVIGITLFRIPRSCFVKSLPRVLLPTVFTCGFIISFIYIVRYHEFVILFLAVSLPLVLQCWLRAFRYAPLKVVPGEAYTMLYTKPRLMRSIRKTLTGIFIFLVIWEFLVSLDSRRRYTGDVAMRETAQLIMWFRTAKEHLANKGVASGITIEPMLFAYAGTGVVMNPQFGLKRIRDCTEDYINAMYHGTETDLAKYCDEHDVSYLVFNQGAAFNSGVYSNYYISGVKKLDPKSPVSLFFNDPDKMSWFYRIAPPSGLSGLNTVYQVFQFISSKARRESLDLCLEGRKALIVKDKEKAKEMARQAVELDPNSDEARFLYLETFGDLPVVTLNGVK